MAKAMRQIVNSVLTLQKEMKELKLLVTDQNSSQIIINAQLRSNMETNGLRLSQLTDVNKKLRMLLNRYKTQKIEIELLVKLLNGKLMEQLCQCGRKVNIFSVLPKIETKEQSSNEQGTSPAQISVRQQTPEFYKTTPSKTEFRPGMNSAFSSPGAPSFGRPLPNVQPPCQLKFNTTAINPSHLFSPHDSGLLSIIPSHNETHGNLHMQPTVHVPPRPSPAGNVHVSQNKLFPKQSQLQDNLSGTAKVSYKECDPVISKTCRITPEKLSSLTLAEQKQLIGEELYPLVKKMNSELAGKITGVLLEMDNHDLLNFLESRELLRSMVDEAISVLGIVKSLGTKV